MSERLKQEYAAVIGTYILPRHKEILREANENGEVIVEIRSTEYREFDQFLVKAGILKESCRYNVYQNGDAVFSLTEKGKNIVESLKKENS